MSFFDGRVPCSKWARVCRGRCAEAKCLVEGECCALAYNEDIEWFDDEDEEFYFVENSSWFQDAFVSGMKERDEMLNGYKTMGEEYMVFASGEKIIRIDEKNKTTDTTQTIVKK